MANVDKEVAVKYNLQLNEKEYFAILALVGRTPYDKVIDSINERYSVRLGRDEEEEYEIISGDEWNELYKMLDENK
jgi:hypothetical protein